MNAEFGRRPQEVDRDTGLEADVNAAQVMTRQPVTAGPTMSVREVAKLLLEHRISAVPVVDASGALLGIVSEGDLVRRRDVARDDRPSWWLEVLAEGEDIAPEFLAYIRSGDRLARDLMTREVVTVEEETPLPEVARLLEEHRIKRVPVLRQGRVVGIVSRADLVRALTHEEETAERPPRPSTPFEMSRPVPPPLTSSEGSSGDSQAAQVCVPSGRLDPDQGPVRPGRKRLGSESRATQDRRPDVNVAQVTTREPVTAGRQRRAKPSGFC